MRVTRPAAKAAQICAVALAMAGALTWADTAMAEPVEGMWQTQPGDDGSYGHVRIYTCGAAICGVLERAYDSSGASVDSDTVGKRMIWDMVPEGDGAYGGGRIWAPDRDKVYRSKMKLNGNRLSVSGCVGPICRGQDWTRVN
ncbi:MAG: DUF2147 domain-containing protein [Pseudomonadota bacterium]